MMWRTVTKAMNPTDIITTSDWCRFSDIYCKEERAMREREGRGGVFFLRARSLVVKLERMKNVLSKKKRLTGDILIPGESSV
jgi:hypothetical protein